MLCICKIRYDYILQPIFVRVQNIKCQISFLEYRPEVVLFLNIYVHFLIRVRDSIVTYYYFIKSIIIRIYDLIIRHFKNIQLYVGFPHPRVIFLVHDYESDFPCVLISVKRNSFFFSISVYILVYQGAFLLHSFYIGQHDKVSILRKIIEQSIIKLLLFNIEFRGLYQLFWSLEHPTSSNNGCNHQHNRKQSKDFLHNLSFSDFYAIKSPC